MFTTSKTLLTLTVSLCATATLTNATPTLGAPAKCNTGSIQCCGSIHTPLSPIYNGLIGSLLGVVINPITAIVGMDCNPLTVVGSGNGASCQAIPVCCSDVNVVAGVAANCSPININL